MGRPSATKKQTTTTSATVDETIVAENSQNVVVDNAEIEEKTKSKTRKVVDDEKVVVKINTIKPGTIEAQFKVTPDGFFELHLDTDDANGFLLRQDDFVEIDLEKKL